MPADNEVREGGCQKYTLDDVADDVFFASPVSAFEKDYDYVVIGTGPCGYAFVDAVLKATSAKSCHILVLERGGILLPDHAQTLEPVVRSLLGGKSETFPFTLSNDMKERDEEVYAHGSVNFLGGRSTVWTAWCPWPRKAGKHPTELRGFPDELIDAVEPYRNYAEKCLGADAPSNAFIYKPEAVPFSRGLVAYINSSFTKGQQILDSAVSNEDSTSKKGGSEPGDEQARKMTCHFNDAYLANIAANRVNSMSPFGKFATVVPFLDLFKSLRRKETDDGSNYLYVLHSLFLDIANDKIGTIHHPLSDNSKCREEDLRKALREIWTSWKEQVAKRNILTSDSSLDLPHYLYMMAAAKHGNPFKKLKTPYSLHAKELLQIIEKEGAKRSVTAESKPSEGATAESKPSEGATAESKPSEYPPSNFDVNKTIEMEILKALPSVSVTCVANACVTKLETDTDTANKTDCPLVKTIEAIVSRETNFGGLCTKKINVSKSRVILAAGMYPAANLLMDSFKDDTIGKDIGAHWTSSVVCRIRRRDAERIFCDVDEIGLINTSKAFEGFDYSEAIYISGYTKVPLKDDESSTPIEANEWHAQLSVVVPSYSTGLRSSATLAAAVAGGPGSMHRTNDPDYVYFNFSMVGEILTNEVEATISCFEKNNSYTKNDSANSASSNDNSDSNSSEKFLNVANGAILDLRLSPLDYASWEKSIEIPVKLMEDLFNKKGAYTFEYYNKSKKKWLNKDSTLSLRAKNNNSRVSFPDYCTGGLVHEGCVLALSKTVYRPGDEDGLPYQYKKASNIFVTGAGLIPSTASWNPTSYLCAMSIHLAYTLANTPFDGKKPGSGGHQDDGKKPGSGGHQDDGKKPGPGGHQDDDEKPGPGGHQDDGKKPGPGEHQDDDEKPAPGGHQDDGKKPGPGGHQDDDEKPATGGHQDDGKKPAPGTVKSPAPEDIRPSGGHQSEIKSPGPEWKCSCGWGSTSHTVYLQHVAFCTKRLRDINDFRTNPGHGLQCECPFCFRTFANGRGFWSHIGTHRNWKPHI